MSAVLIVKATVLYLTSGQPTCPAILPAISGFSTKPQKRTN